MATDTQISQADIRHRTRAATPLRMVVVLASDGPVRGPAGADRAVTGPAGDGVDR